MKQVLSVEQMKHLQELGLDTSDASMHWQYLTTVDAIINGTDEIEEEPTLFVSQPNMKHEYPAYTLQDILDKLPTLIIISSDFYKICIELSCGYWDIYYYKSDATELISKKSENIIDVAYDMLCWCIEKGYIKTKE